MASAHSAKHSKHSATTSTSTDDARHLRYALSPRVERPTNTGPFDPWALSPKLCLDSDDGFGESLAEWTQGCAKVEALSGQQVR